MKIMLDTNVLISALIFPNYKMNEIIKYLDVNKCFYISTYVINETKRVVKEKFPHAINKINIFFEKGQFYIIKTPINIKKNLFKIRDPNDYPVLYSAIISNIYLITGDKDFKDINIEKPLILTPNDFYNKYILN